MSNTPYFCHTTSLLMYDILRYAVRQVKQMSNTEIDV